MVAQDRDGDTVAELALPRSGTFSLTYRHSYYRRPAVERFAAADDGSFRLVEIASPSEAVLEYYDVEGARAAPRRLVDAEARAAGALHADGARRAPPWAAARSWPTAAARRCSGATGVPRT